MHRWFPLLALVLIGCAAPSVVMVGPTPYPTHTPYPTYTPLATLTAYPTHTALPSHTPLPTFTPPPTATRAPTEAPRTPTSAPTTTATVHTEPTTVPTAEAPEMASPVAATTAPTAQANTTYEPPFLIWPEPKYDICDHKGDTVFRWRWDGQLKADEYFQVQIVSRDTPNFGEHRGIHAPTKDYTASTNRELWGHFRDWENVHDRGWFSAARIYADWTVAIVQWDGIDASRIGPIIVEAAPCDIRF